MKDDKRTQQQLSSKSVSQNTLPEGAGLVLKHQRCTLCFKQRMGAGVSRLLVQVLLHTVCSEKRRRQGYIRNNTGLLSPRECRNPQDTTAFTLTDRTSWKSYATTILKPLRKLMTQRHPMKYIAENREPFISENRPVAVFILGGASTGVGKKKSAKLLTNIHV